jgi:hypothetical protein
VGKQWTSGWEYPSAKNISSQFHLSIISVKQRTSIQQQPTNNEKLQVVTEVGVKVLRRANWQRVADVSEDRSVSIFRVQHSKMSNTPENLESC